MTQRPCRNCGSTTTERTPAGRCKPCYNASCRASKARRWEAHKAEARAWGKRNSARLVDERRARRLQDPDYAAAVAERAARIRDTWRRANPGAHAAHEAARRAAVRRATPAWLTDAHRAAIQALYRDAASRSGEWHVDHVVPLQGKSVCSLHVPWNLQVISGSANRARSNVFHDS